MTDRPIIFSAAMIRRIHEEVVFPGKGKRQTRRLAKRQDIHRRSGRPFIPMGVNREVEYTKLGYEKGDRLWVKENHRLVECDCPETCRVPGMVWYEANGTGYDGARGNKLRPSIHMPRWASRYTLNVTDVRIERLKEISEDDAHAEGIFEFGNLGFYGYDKQGTPGPDARDTARETFSALWDRINGDRPGAAWRDNPWIVAVSFTPEWHNIDQSTARAA